MDTIMEPRLQEGREIAQTWRILLGPAGVTKKMQETRRKRPGIFWQVVKEPLSIASVIELKNDHGEETFRQRAREGAACRGAESLKRALAAKCDPEKQRKGRSWSSEVLFLQHV